MAAGTWFVENSRGRFCARMADHRSLLGKREGMKTRRECQYTRELDLETLVWTRGPNFPLSSLDGRLMCPRCWSPACGRYVSAAHGCRKIRCCELIQRAGQA